MIYLNNPMSLQIENIDFAVRDIQNDYLFFVDHSKEVNDVLVLVFPQNFTILIEMNDALLLARVINSHQDESVVVSRRYAEDLLHGWLQRYLGHIF